MFFSFGGVRATAMVNRYEEAVELAKYAESLNYDGVWFSDSISFRDSYTVMALCAEATKKILIGVGVANPFTRHPLVTARAIATVDEVSRGRAALCMATGDLVEIIRPMGYDVRKPYVMVREAIELVRKYLAGEEVHFSGEFFNVSGLKLGFQSNPRIPIYVAGGGPRIMEVAGAVADGAFINYFDSKLIEQSVEHVKKGASSAQAKEDFRLLCFGPLIVTHDNSERESVLKDLKGFIALNILLTPEKWVLAAGVKQETLDTIRREYIVGAHRDLELERKIIEKISSVITDDIMDLYCIVGKSEYVVERLKLLERSGIGGVVIWMQGKADVEKRRVLKNISEEIMPSFR